MFRWSLEWFRLSGRRRLAAVGARSPLISSALVLFFMWGCAQSGSRTRPVVDGGWSDGAPRDGDAQGDGKIPLGCGDGELGPGEGCDDGNLLDGDGCSSGCQVEDGWGCQGEPSECVLLCGNGTLDQGEDCDGDNLAGQNCLTLGAGYAGGSLSCTATCAFDTSRCILPGCGNGVIDQGEDCDDGNTDDTDDCPTTCRQAFCGDGFIWAGHEECDDGNTVSGDGCSAGCLREYCGDGIVQGGLGEDCDGDPDRTCTTSCGTQGRQSCSNGCRWGSCQPPSEVCNAVDDDCDGAIDTLACMNHLYRFYNASTGDHMFKVNDRNPDPGYVLENAGFYLYATQVPGTHVFYQRYNPTWGDHMTTSSTTEGDAAGFVGAEVLGYISLQADNTWSVAGLAPSQYCRYWAVSVQDHLSLPRWAGMPPGYQQDYCANWWWGAY